MGQPIISKSNSDPNFLFRNTDSMFLMLHLTERFHTEWTSVFQKELVLAIFWEEGAFTNGGQLAGGPAAG